MVGWKIRLLGFVDTVVAQQSSKNRKKGDLEVKTVNANRKMMEKMMGKLSDAIDKKWPPNHRHRVVKVQMDNATPHINNDNESWKKKRAGKRIKVELV